MTQKDLLQLVSKSLGLYFIVQAALFARYMVFGIADIWNSGFLVLGQTLVDFLTYVVVSWALIAKSGLISKKLAISSSEVRLDVNKQDVLEVAIIVVGLLTCISSATDVFGKLVHFIYFNEFDRNESNQFWDMQNRKADIFFSIFKLAAGLVVLVKHKPIGNWLVSVGNK